MNGTLTLMLVDDHAVVRAGYRLLLAQAEGIEVVAEAESGEEACQRYFEVGPAVVVMDLNLPGIGGLAAIRRISARDPQARILACSIHEEAVYVSRALEAGAKGYLSKRCDPEILVEALRRVARGESYVDPALGYPIAEHALRNGQAPLQCLSAREFDVFCLLARGHTVREVADELRMGHKTAANYSTAIKAKLSVATTAEMARLAIQFGVIKGPD